MKNRSLAVDQTSCTQRAFKFTPNKLYCPVGEICFCREGLQYKHNNKKKFLNGHVMGFKTFVIYTDGGNSNTAEKH